MRARWALLCVLGWSLALVGVAEADIFPVATPTIALGGFPYTVKATSPVTLAIRQNGVDKPDWLPEPGVPVEIVVKVNTAEVTSGFTIRLVPPATGVTFDGVTNPFLNPTPTTSAYRGQCENADNPAPMTQDAPDFGLSGNTLTPTDCGGFAVLDVEFELGSELGGGVFTFIVPSDADPSYLAGDGRNANGIPAVWEALFCTATFPCPTGREDTDAPPVSTTHFGDGISAHAEYRGFMVRGVHIRTDPRQKDIFIFLANPQCNPGGNGEPTPSDQELSVLGGATTAPLLGDDLFDGVAHLFGAAQTHLLHTPGASNYKSAEWVDLFVKYTTSTGVVTDPPGSASDRRLNTNFVLTAGGIVPKGVRVIECPVTTSGALGLASPGSVNDNTGFAILFPQRIITAVNNLVAGGGGKQLKHGTYEAGRKTTPVLTGNGDPTNPDNVNIWVRLYLQHVAAQEVLHVGDRVNPSGGHTAAEAGYFTDITIYNKVDNKASGFNTTYFPSGPNAVGSGDKANFLVVP